MNGYRLLRRFWHRVRDLVLRAGFGLLNLQGRLSRNVALATPQNSPQLPSIAITSALSLPERMVNISHPEHGGNR